MTNDLAIRILSGDVLGTTEQTHEAVAMAVKALSALPSSDVVEVVRCKDCKSFSHGYCKFHDAKFVREDGYCYWGERKNDG